MKDEDRAEQSPGPCNHAGNDTCAICPVPRPYAVCNDSGTFGD